MTHYETLGVKPDATADDIKRAYRRAASAAHPDREGGSHERMQHVNRAHDVLIDPKRRARYDQTGEDEVADLERMAHDLLVQTFERALQGDEDPVRSARRYLLQLHKQISASKDELERQSGKLARRSGKTMVKSGDNLVQMLIDRRIQDLTRQVEQAKEALQVHAKATEMLEQYEGEPEPPAAPVSHSIDAMMYAMQGMQQNGFRGWNAS